MFNSNPSSLLHVLLESCCLSWCRAKPGIKNMPWPTARSAPPALFNTLKERPSRVPKRFAGAITWTPGQPEHHPESNTSASPSQAIATRNSPIACHSSSLGPSSHSSISSSSLHIALSSHLKCFHHSRTTASHAFAMSKQPTLSISSTECLPPTAVSSILEILKVRHCAIQRDAKLTSRR